MVCNESKKNEYEISKLLAILFIFELAKFVTNFNFEQELIKDAWGLINESGMPIFAILCFIASVRLFVKRKKIKASKVLCKVNIIACFLIVIIEIITDHFGRIQMLTLLACNSDEYMRCLFRSVPQGYWRSAAIMEKINSISTIFIFLCCLSYVKVYSKIYFQSENGV